MWHPTRVAKTTAAVVGVGLALTVGGVAGDLATGSTAGSHVTAKQIPNLGIVKNQIKAYYGDTGGHEPTVGSDYWAEVTGDEGKALRTLPKLISRATARPTTTR
jgi:hypothetical protein